MQFEMKFDTDNAAFEDNFHEEIARILRSVAIDFADHEIDLSYTHYRNVYDANGNIVGTWRIK